MRKKMEKTNKASKIDLLIIFSITLMAVLGLSSTTPSFPKIAEFFDVGKIVEFSVDFEAPYPHPNPHPNLDPHFRLARRRTLPPR